MKDSTKVMHDKCYEKYQKEMSDYYQSRDFKGIRLCSFCEKNDSSAWYHRLIYIICCESSSRDKVSSVSEAICNDCIEELKQKGYLTDHIEDIDFGFISTFQNKNSDIVYTPYSDNPERYGDTSSERVFIGFIYISPFGNGMDEKFVPTLYCFHKTNRMSVNITQWKSKDFSRDPKIIFMEM